MWDDGWDDWELDRVDADGEGMQILGVGIIEMQGGNLCLVDRIGHVTIFSLKWLTDDWSIVSLIVTNYL